MTEGAGALVKNNDNCIFMIKAERRGMVRWELPTRIVKKGETIFLAVYKCIEEESFSQLTVRIGRPICLGLNSSNSLGHSLFAIFFECTVERSNIALIKSNEPTSFNLPNEAQQRIIRACFIDWRQLDARDIHPQHEKILNIWQQMPNGPFFAVASDGDSEVAFYNSGDLPMSVIRVPLGLGLENRLDCVYNEDCNTKNNQIAEGKDMVEISQSSIVSVLFLSADPINAVRLQLNKELREIQEKLRLAKLRDKFILNISTSVRIHDVSQALLDYTPCIVHFAGHGEPSGALCVENESGQSQRVSPAALAALFKEFSRHVRCVVLNACYSETQASAISKHIEYVIGIKHAIPDYAAIAFSVGFYQALGAGKTFEEAFRLGCALVELQDIPEHLTPVLLEKPPLKIL